MKGAGQERGCQGGRRWAVNTNKMTMAAFHKRSDVRGTSGMSPWESTLRSWYVRHSRGWEQEFHRGPCLPKRQTDGHRNRETDRQRQTYIDRLTQKDRVRQKDIGKWTRIDTARRKDKDRWTKTDRHRQKNRQTRRTDIERQSQTWTGGGRQIDRHRQMEGQAHGWSCRRAT